MGWKDWGAPGAAQGFPAESPVDWRRLWAREVLAGVCFVLVFALMVNYAAIAFYGPAAPFDGDTPIYLGIAQALAAGKGYVSPDSPWPDVPTTGRMPVWCVLLSVPLKLLPQVHPHTNGSPKNSISTNFVVPHAGNTPKPPQIADKAPAYGSTFALRSKLPLETECVAVQKRLAMTCEPGIIGPTVFDQLESFPALDAPQRHSQQPGELTLGEIAQLPRTFGYRLAVEGRRLGEGPVFSTPAPRTAENSDEVSGLILPGHRRHIPIFVAIPS